jgi:hypothetical protein
MVSLQYNSYRDYDQSSPLPIHNSLSIRPSCASVMVKVSVMVIVKVMVMVIVNVEGVKRLPPHAPQTVPLYTQI